MKVTDLLQAEHRVIETVLDALEEGARRLSTGRSVSAEFFLDAVEFIRGFADAWHHRKEEGVLFKALVRHGFPERQGPVGVMLLEHEQGRRLTEALHAAALRLQAGDTAASAEIAKNALAYAALLGQHIRKEDGVLYIMAEQATPSDEQATMAEECERLERENGGPEVRDKFLALAADLPRRLGALSSASG